MCARRNTITTVHGEIKGRDVQIATSSREFFVDGAKIPKDEDAPRSILDYVSQHVEVTNVRGGRDDDTDSYPII